MKNMLVYPLVVIMLLILSSGFCMAASEAMNDQLLCALTEVIECDELGQCLSVTADDAGLPDFVLVDMKEKKLMGASSVDSQGSKFSTSETAEGLTILTGVDGGRGWSAVLSADKTRLNATISDEMVGFVVFAACRAQ